MIKKILVLTLLIPTLANASYESCMHAISNKKGVGMTQYDYSIAASYCLSTANTEKEIVKPAKKWVLNKPFFNTWRGCSFEKFAGKEPFDYQYNTDYQSSTLQDLPYKMQIKHDDKNGLIYFNCNTNRVKLVMMGMPQVEQDSPLDFLQGEICK